MLKKIIPLSLLAMSTTVNAGGYVGAGFGESSADVTPYYYPGVTTSVSDTDTAFKLFGGYEFNDNVAVEGGYVKFGEFGVTYSDGSFDNVEASAIYVAAVGSIPLGPVTLFGKAGFANWFVDYSAIDTAAWYWAWSDTATGIDPMVGLGVKFDVSQNFAVRGEAERFLDVGDAAFTGQSDIDVLSVSAVLKF